MTSILVLKRDGRKEPLDFDKIHKVVHWACEGLDVSESELELNARLKFYDKIKSSDIQKTLVRSAAELISEDAPDYQYVAGRLISYDLRKEVYGQPEPLDLYSHVKNVVEAGFYEPKLLEWYSKEDWDYLNTKIDHSRDDDIVYAGMELFRTKYLVKNRLTGKILETPQMAMMVIAALFFHRYENDRLKWVVDFYNSLSTFEINMPTPIMAKFRTRTKQFSSCVLIETDDSLDSIYASAAAIGKYIAKHAGIGIGAAKLRAFGDSIRNGEATHSGKIGFYRVFQSTVQSANQGNLRKGSATLNYVGWDLEYDDLIVLKNNKGTEETRLRDLDYCIQVNRMFYQRLIEGGNITLMSTRAVPGMLDAFYTDFDKFMELYEAAEKNPKIRKKTIPAHEWFEKFIEERKNTHRIYLSNVDNANIQGPYIPELAPLKMTNLCVEIFHPTKPVTSDPNEGIIGLCTLAAVNWGKLKKPQDFKRPMELIVRGLNELLDYQDYPVEAGRRGALNYRQLGIGIVGFAHWMAKQGYSYQDPSDNCLLEVDRWAQFMTYYGLRASCDLAKERGNPFPAISQSKYAGGILPVDTYNRNMDELVTHVNQVPWGELRQDISDYGLFNGALFAGMPVETSSLVSNSPNSWEPVRSLVSVKENKDQIVKQVVPEIKKLGKRYEKLWDIKNPRGYLTITLIFQKYFDLALSVNTTYNPKFYPDGEIENTEMVDDLIFFYRHGGKNLYYLNMPDDAGEEVVEDEEDCESCKL
ncbi:ribonucleotide reductase of class Ia (aerobic) alpha subunit [Caulobacter phage Cr30]|uniref:ribonucleotide reductase large subunit n=1 Tax=Caulobacter phage Cr30 TaxID=1357714 RepID=UPI0004A9B807|nr:ribonucleotide reductase large subunit [Caulobacter phage Cr30]AGS80933.1 ribonucleotide reductase of class Ia (aerobic) alpha subunit [Caulobacter phage Cr30]